MIPTNAMIIRKAYDDFARGDIPAVLEAFDASIIWHRGSSCPCRGRSGSSPRDRQGRTQRSLRGIPGGACMAAGE